MINQTINTEARPVPEQLLQYFQTSEHMVINTHNWAKENTQCMVSHPAGLQTPGPIICKREYHLLLYRSYLTGGGLPLTWRNRVCRCGLLSHGVTTYLMDSAPEHHRQLCKTRTTNNTKAP